MLKIADANEPPLRVFFGEEPATVVKDIYASRLATWAEWKQVALEADGKNR